MTTSSDQAARTHATGTKTKLAPRPPTKKTQLIKLLSRKSGVDIPTISAKLGWQPHTTRAALSGLRQAGLDLTNETAGTGKPLRYHILRAPNQDAGGTVHVE